jgi:uncharacterized protein YbjT (DUF2867 family)
MGFNVKRGAHMLLVTGITGHTGKFFIQELSENRYNGLIRCIVRETSDTSNIDDSGLKVEKVYGDLNDENFVRKAMRGVDTIIHIYNINYSQMIIEIAIMNNVKRAILVHTTGIYSNFKHASKAYIDIEKRVFAITSASNCPTKITILRPTMIYGDICDRNISKFISMIDKLRIIPIVDKGRNLIQPVNARDLGKAFYEVLMFPQKTDGKSYDLSGEKPLRMIEVFQMIAVALKKKTIFISVPLELSVFLAKIIKILTKGKFDFIEKIERMGENRSYPHIEAMIDFKYKPMSFEEGLKIEVNQYMLKKKMIRE